MAIYGRQCMVDREINTINWLEYFEHITYINIYILLLLVICTLMGEEGIRGLSHAITETCHLKSNFPYLHLILPCRAGKVFYRTEIKWACMHD